MKRKRLVAVTWRKCDKVHLTDTSAEHRAHTRCGRTIPVTDPLLNPVVTVSHTTKVDPAKVCLRCLWWEVQRM